MMNFLRRNPHSALNTFTAGYVLFGDGTENPVTSANLTFVGGTFTVAGLIKGAGIVGSGGVAPDTSIYNVQAWTSGAVELLSFVDPTRSANNKIANWQFANGSLDLTFWNDNFSAGPANAIQVAGGYAAGVTSVILTAGAATATLTTTGLAVVGTVKTSGYTVAGLPAGVVGARAYVTNALTPVFGAAVVGGGAVTIPVFYDGTNWIVG